MSPATISSGADSAASSRRTALPGYADELAAFHRAFQPELSELIQWLPLQPEMSVIDIGCGDGFYLGRLAERLNASAFLVGMDRNPAYLELARQNQEISQARCRVEFIEGELADLPPLGQRFDFIWCAQCLYSFPEPVEALRTMGSAVKPGGIVAVMENDTLHQVLLPWPSHLELALRAAELQALEAKSRQPSKYYVGRCLPALFHSAGIMPLGYRTQCIDRRAPLDDELSTFLQVYLDRLAKRVCTYLEPTIADEFAALIDPTSCRFVGSSRVDLQACKLEYSIVSPK